MNSDSQSVFPAFMLDRDIDGLVLSGVTDTDTDRKSILDAPWFIVWAFSFECNRTSLFPLPPELRITPVVPHQRNANAVR
jgi:hypothetical protein